VRADCRTCPRAWLPGRWLAALALLVALAALAGGRPAAAQTLRLDARTPEVAVWPVVTVLHEAAAPLTLDRGAGPPRPTSAAAGCWRSTTHPLNEVDVHVVSDGRPVAHHRLGNALPFDQRPMQSRAHAVTLDLPAGQSHELFLRVHSTSSLLVPLRLYREDAFLQHESQRELVQGLMIGVTLALLVYSVVNGVSLRDPLFWQYALMLLGVTTFFVSYTGIGNQHLWNEQTGLLAKIAPLGILLALAAGSLFVSGALDTASTHPRVALGLRAISALAVVAFVASVSGLIDYRWTQAAATALGPIPIVLALRVAWRRAREGDRIAQLMVLGWGAYTVGAFSMAGLLRGWLPVDFWMQHLFQIGSLVEMLAWVRVLGVRIDEACARRRAGRARAQGICISLAHTDPLTGLPNRRGLQRRAAGAMPPARADHAVALFMLDLDGFKPDQRPPGPRRRRRTAGAGRPAPARPAAPRRHGGAHGRRRVRRDGHRPAERGTMPPCWGRSCWRPFAQPFVVAGRSCRVGLTAATRWRRRTAATPPPAEARRRGHVRRQAGRPALPARGGVSTMSRRSRIAARSGAQADAAGQHRAAPRGRQRQPRASPFTTTGWCTACSSGRSFIESL
jgi:hypothetical protein